MKKLVLAIVPLLLLSACTKLQRAKWAYSRGNFEKSVSLLEEALSDKQSDPAVQKYLVLARAGLWTDQAAKAITGQDYSGALEKLDDALGLDPKNSDAQHLLNQCVDKIKESVKNDLVPAGRWDKVISLTAVILKYRPEDTGLEALKAEAVFHNEKDVLNWRSIPAIELAFAKAADNAFLKEKTEILAAKTQKFRALFETYEKALAAKDFKNWNRLISARHLSEAKVDLKTLADKGDTQVKTLEDYFRVISDDPAKYGSPDGAQLICVEPLSETHAFVHFKYKNLPKVMKMEVVAEGGSLKFQREEDSEIPATAG